MGAGYGNNRSMSEAMVNWVRSHIALTFWPTLYGDRSRANMFGISVTHQRAAILGI
jgi:hypothetical protein